MHLSFDVSQIALGIEMLNQIGSSQRNTATTSKKSIYNVFSREVVLCEIITQ